MAKDPEQVAKLQKAFVKGSVIAGLGSVPTIALLVWGLTNRHNATLNAPELRWPIVAVLLALIVYELWLGYWFMLRPIVELGRLPHTDKQGAKQ